MKEVQLRRMMLAFCGAAPVLLLAILLLEWTNTPLVLASLGGSCVILFGMPDGDMARPRSLIGGHFIGAMAGLLCLKLFGSGEIVMAFAIGFALMAMMATDTIHSPAGANPLIVIWTGADWSFLFMPVLLGVLILFAGQQIWRRTLYRYW